MSLNHLLDTKELDIKAKSLDIDSLESNLVFTKGYSGVDHALDTSFSSYALVPTPRFAGATLYFSECKDPVLPAPPSSPGMYEVDLGKSCIITRSGNCVTQKYSFTAKYNQASVASNGYCELYFILNNINPIDPSTYSIIFSGQSISSNGYRMRSTLPTISTKTEAGNTYGILTILWDKADTGRVEPGLNEEYICEFTISWLENPISPP